MVPRQYEIVAIGNIETDKKDLMQDVVSLITSMGTGLYSLRGSKRKKSVYKRFLGSSKDEIYKCACGDVMDADHNAAGNILHIEEYGPDAL